MNEINNNQIENIELENTINQCDTIANFINNNLQFSNDKKIYIEDYKKLIKYLNNENILLDEFSSSYLMDYCPVLSKMISVLESLDMKILSENNNYVILKDAYLENINQEDLDFYDDEKLFSNNYNNNDLDLIKLYYHELSEYKLLSHEETIELAYRIRNNDEKARELLCNSNLRLVVKTAKKFHTEKVAFLDLIQYGNEGLLKAIEKYDPDKKYRFSTYSLWWIKLYIQRGIINENRTIRIPEKAYFDIRKIKEIINQLNDKYGQDVDIYSKDIIKKLSSILKINEDTIKLLLSYSQDVSSLNVTIEDDGIEIMDLIEDENVESAYSQLLRNELRNEFNNTKLLTERERNILYLRYGLCDGKEYTLEDIGKKYNLTRERIRVIVNEAIAKLSKSEKLKEYTSSYLTKEETRELEKYKYEQKISMMTPEEFQEYQENIYREKKKKEEAKRKKIEEQKHKEKLKNIEKELEEKKTIKESKILSRSYLESLGYTREEDRTSNNNIFGSSEDYYSFLERQTIKKR